MRLYRLLICPRVRASEQWANCFLSYSDITAIGSMRRQRTHFIAARIQWDLLLLLTRPKSETVMLPIALKPVPTQTDWTQSYCLYSSLCHHRRRYYCLLRTPNPLWIAFDPRPNILQRTHARVNHSATHPSTLFNIDINPCEMKTWNISGVVSLYCSIYMRVLFTFWNLSLNDDVLVLTWCSSAITFLWKKLSMPNVCLCIVCRYFALKKSENKTD